MRHPTGFPARLVRLRAEAGMTQSDLAKASGISKPQIGRYETGISTPRMTALVKLAKALDVDVSILQSADGEPANVELDVLVAGEAKPFPVALPAELHDSIAADAEKAGVSFEEQFSVVCELGWRALNGIPGTLEEVRKERRARHLKSSK